MGRQRRHREEFLRDLLQELDQITTEYLQVREILKIDNNNNLLLLLLLPRDLDHHDKKKKIVDQVHHCCVLLNRQNLLPLPLPLHPRLPLLYLPLKHLLLLLQHHHQPMK